MNQINVIAPYKYMNEIWVFDDPSRGLVQEAFVGGADTILDLLTAQITGAQTGFTLIFSSADFPGSQHRLEWRRPDMSGNTYYSPDLQMEGWLCPALLRYFDAPPAEIFVQVKASSKENPNAHA